MASLKSLNLVALPKASSNPTLDRRARVVARLEEQKLLLQDSAYHRVVRSWSKNEAGEKALVCGAFGWATVHRDDIANAEAGCNPSRVQRVVEFVGICPKLRKGAVVHVKR